MPRCELRNYEARRIALIKPSALGDIVHAMPVLTALRNRFPTSSITWIVNRAFQPLLQGHPLLNETLAFDRGASRKGIGHAARAYASFFRELRRRRFDLAIDLQGLLRSGLMTAATGAARRVGLRSAREGSRWFYTDQVIDIPDMHAVDRYWLIAEALGAGAGPKQTHLSIDHQAGQWAAREMADSPRPWLMLAVGSRWLTKRWPPAHFAALAAKAQAFFGGTVVFVGGAEEAHLASATLAGLTGPSRDFSGRTTLPQLTAMLAQADAVVANDTGPLHIAVALGRPVVAPYTCTKVRLTGPYQAIGGAVETRVWCQGSLLKNCHRMECMAELTPDRLWPILNEVLGTWQRRSRSA
jgi:lipopolysaccharide heptosyltransferase I